MSKTRVKLRKGEAVDVMKLANGLVNKLICNHGSRIAFVVARLVHEKTFANYKRLERNYPNEEVN